MAVIDAATVEQELRSKNTKIIERADIDWRATGNYHIFNVGPHKWEVGRGGLGTFIIPACPEGAECSSPLKVPKQYPEGKDLDMNKMAEILRDGMKLAVDIVGYSPHQSPGADLRRYGVFLAKGDEPTKKELADAKTRLRESDLKLVNEANSAYLAGNIQEVRLSEHIRAAIATGNENLGWVRGAEQKDRCPVCQTAVDQKAAICVACKAVLNEQVVIANKVPGYEHLWKKQASA